METQGSVTYAIAIGQRQYQEDRYFYKRISKDGRTGYLVAVMDGHNGDGASEFCFQHIDENFSIREGEDAEEALCGLVLKLANATTDFNSGTCITVAYVDERINQVSVAVLGDCPAIVIDKNNQVHVSPVHSIRNNLKERVAAEKRGGYYGSDGYIFNPSGSYKLQIGRSLGDARMFGVTSREPETYTIQNPRFIALVTDGVLEIGQECSDELIEEFVRLSETNSTAADLLEYTDALLILRDNATIVLWQCCVMEI